MILLLVLAIFGLTALALWLNDWYIHQPWRLEDEWETDGFLIKRKRR